MKKAIGLVMSAVLLAVTALGMFGCYAGGADYEELDPTKTQLYIGNYDGGMKDEWIKVVADKFEQEYADYQFEPDTHPEKRGVQVMIDSSMNYSGDTLLGNMPYQDQQIYFTHTITYDSFAASGVTLDITDWVTEKVYDENGNMVRGTDGKLTSDGATDSIVDRMESQFAEYYNVGSAEQPQYFGLPFAQIVGGIWYDADLFDYWGFYLWDNGQPGARRADVDAQIANPDGVARKVSAGPDGVDGTYDDGLPETWNDFLDLLDYMVPQGIVPFTWDGVHTYQRTWLFDTLLASYEGPEDFALNLTLNGTDSNQTDISVTPQTGYELTKQNGRFAAVKIVSDIVKNSSYYSTAAFSGAQTHAMAQREFLRSTLTAHPIAFFVEGSYWVSEARSIFDEMAEDNASLSYQNRDIRYFPIPRMEGVAGVPDQVNSTPTLAGRLSTTAVLVNAKADNEVTKKFIQFMHSRESLVIFQQYANAFRPFEYEFTDDELKASSKYTQSLANVLETGGTIVSTLPQNTLIERNASFFDYWRECSTIDNYTYSNIFQALRGNVSAADYFAGMFAYAKNNWPKE